MSNQARNPGKLLGKVDALEAGTKKNIVGNMTVAVMGVAMTQAQIVAKCEGYDAGYAAVAAARTALKQALSAWVSLEADARKFIVAYSHSLKGLLGSGNPLLADFGINPAKATTKRTSAQKAVTAALTRQTKEVRGVRGQKQKAAITVQGRPGLVLVSPTGEPIPTGPGMGPIPPGSAEPVDAAGSLTGSGGGSPGASGGSSSPPSSGGSSGK
ncbi:MAG: hypothetical protein ACYCWW_15355 [Deltaproteobacteria bacterium]